MSEFESPAAGGLVSDAAPGGDAASPARAATPRTRTRRRREVAEPPPPVSVVIDSIPEVLTLESIGPGGPAGPTVPTDFNRPEPPAREWLPAGAATGRSSYLDYLPGIFSSNDFLARYLLIFETILEPIQRTVDNLPHYFDPSHAPADTLPWLGSWLGLLLDERWPDAQRRELIRAAADLYRWRGTARGMAEFIRVYAGIAPEIIEPTLSEVSASSDLAYRFTVRLTLPAGVEVDRDLLEQIIETEKPAFAAGTLEIIRTPA